jgi:hemin uptake protein HemP
MDSDTATPAPDRLTPATGTPAAASPAEAGTRRLSSAELLGSARELQISHGDALYRLRLTSLGKLILTK